MCTWIPLAAPADLISQLGSLLAEEFDPDVVAGRLAAALSPAVKGVLVEHNYIDKDYRSTYYGFYAKKGKRYGANCVRLHLFDATVTYDAPTLRIQTSDSSRKNALTDHYFGYVVLRPTTVATIGRSVIAPGIRKGALGQTITADHKVHVLGYKLTVEGFPSMDQHRDIGVCAHAACWSILRHYSERYSTHREFLTHEITMMAQEFDPGGLVPSDGLKVSNAERVFQAAHTFPLIVERASDGKGQPLPDEPFFRQLLAYIDSGFPLFIAMYEVQHAIAGVGYNSRPAAAPATGTAPTGLGHAWDRIDTITAVDDNELPYLPVPVTSTPGAYSAQNFSAFIVPLPEKIYYPADAVDGYAIGLYSGPFASLLPPKDETIIRYFVTTASGLRGFVRENASQFDASLFEVIMRLPLAQFVWVIEYATRSQWGDNKITARAVIDATASEHEEVPLWFIHGSNEAWVFDRQAIPTDAWILPFTGGGRPDFSRMSNLKTTQVK